MTTGGEVYFYVGTKEGAGSPIERAGLDSGALYTLSIDGFASSSTATRSSCGSGLT